MKYFKYVKFWKIILLNVIVGFLISGPLFIGLFIMSGSMFSGPTLTDKVQGMAIILISLLVLMLANYILWISEKKKLPKEEQLNLDDRGNDKKSFLKLVILLIVMGLVTLSFFFDDIWLFFNGWWF